jgi:hypothetical protein
VYSRSGLAWEGWEYRMVKKKDGLRDWLSRVAEYRVATICCSRVCSARSAEYRVAEKQPRWFSEGQVNRRWLILVQLFLPWKAS